MGIYNELKKENVPIGSHESDLYCKVTKVSKKIVERYVLKRSVRSFKNQIDGSLWFDIPFEYEPYYSRLNKKMRKHK